MRQRPSDVGTVRLFVETQPRPVNQPNQVRSSGISSPGAPNKSHKKGSRNSYYVAIFVSLLALGMLGYGYCLVRENKYSFLHRQMVINYHDYMEEWFSKHSASFENSKFTLEIEGGNITVPLGRQMFKSKRGLNRSMLESNLDASQDLVEFATSQPLVDILFPVAEDPSSPPLAESLPSLPTTAPLSSLSASSRVLRGGKSGLRRVTPDMQKPFSARLIAVDGLTGKRSDLMFKHPIQIDTMGPAPGVKEHKCSKDFGGTWDKKTCYTHRYLWNMCVKVTRDASGEYSLDETGGDVGCFANTWPSYSPYMWRPLYISNGGGPVSNAVAPTPLDVHRMKNDDVLWAESSLPRVAGGVASKLGLQRGLYLPFMAQHAMRFTVRHARDPDVLERGRLRYIGPNLDRQMLWNAVGWALCFLGLVLFLAVSIWACQSVADSKTRAAAQRVHSSVSQPCGANSYNERYGVSGGAASFVSVDRLTRRGNNVGNGSNGGGSSISLSGSGVV